MMSRLAWRRRQKMSGESGFAIGSSKLHSNGSQLTSRKIQRNGFYTNSAHRLRLNDPFSTFEGCKCHTVLQMHAAQLLCSAAIYLYYKSEMGVCVCVCVCVCSSGRLNLVWGISVCSTNLARRALLLARRALNVRWDGA